MILLYHGSSTIISEPLVNIGRKNLDFGPGFYLTSIYKQAEQWARRISIQRGSSTAYVSHYEFDERIFKDNAYRICRFTSYDKQWLEFIVASRKGESPWELYDIIEGGIADDKVIEAVEAYIAGYASVETTLGQLAYAKPNHQICIRNQEIIDTHLKFIKYNKFGL
ncbi:MAG: DUF3990 domain-containing protein [Muribaculaceae bacterium]|nr:DUF3990 domain-containing protein [Muribaculaceae bacterium]